MNLLITNAAKNRNVLKRKKRVGNFNNYLNLHGFCRLNVINRKNINKSMKVTCFYGQNQMMRINFFCF